MPSTLLLPADYGYVIATVGVIGLVQFTNGVFAQIARKHFQSKELLENPKFKALQDEHKKLYGTNIAAEGYPDMGNGRYAAFLSYEHWYEFNNAQRGHYNMMETSGPVLASLVVSGLYQPKIMAGIGMVYAVSRLVYALGYVKIGPSGRLVGSGLSAITSFALYGSAIYFGVKSVM